MKMLRLGWTGVVIGVATMVVGILLARQGEVHSFIDALDREAVFLTYFSPLTLVLGALLTLIGGLLVCIKERPPRLAIAGAATCVVLLSLSAPIFLNANVHTWTGLLPVLWFFAAFMATVFLLVALVRFVIFRLRSP